MTTAPGIEGTLLRKRSRLFGFATCLATMTRAWGLPLAMRSPVTNAVRVYCTLREGERVMLKWMEVVPPGLLRSNFVGLRGRRCLARSEEKIKEAGQGRPVSYDFSLTLIR